MNPKPEIAKRVGVTIALLSFWPVYDTIIKVLVCIVAGILLMSCIVISFKNRLQPSRWGRLTEWSEFEVTYAALGFGMVASGLRFVTGGLTWAGVATVVAGAVFVAAGIADNSGNAMRARRKK